MNEPEYSTVCVMTPAGDVWLSKNVPKGQEYWAITKAANTDKPAKQAWFRIPTDPGQQEIKMAGAETLYRPFEYDTITFERGDQIKGLEFFKEQPPEDEDDEEFEEPDYDCTIK